MQERARLRNLGTKYNDDYIALTPFPRPKRLAPAGVHQRIVRRNTAAVNTPGAQNVNDDVEVDDFEQEHLEVPVRTVFEPAVPNEAPRQGPSVWELRNKKEAQAWQDARPVLVEQLIGSAVQHHELRQSLATLQLQHLQDAVQQSCHCWWQHHSCSPQLTDAVGAQMQLLQPLEVTYIGLTCSGALQVGVHACSACGATFQPQPIQHGCFPSSPDDCHAWYDLKVHQAYKELGLRHGLSSTGFVTFLREHSAAAVNEQQFRKSFFAFLRTAASANSLQALGVQNLDTGPFCDCPICAKVPAATTGGGEEEEEEAAYPLAVAMDAVTKWGHYAHCGSASKTILPEIRKHLGPVHDAVQHAASEGRLSLHHLTCPEPAADGADRAAHACATSLSCSRETACKGSGPCDVHGVCGAVCMHGIPLRELFTDMPLPENFSYYLLQLDHLMRERADLRQVYIDFGCRIKSTWQRYVAAHPDLPPEAAELEILVNWLHGSSHDVACQVNNSGRYTAGAGRRIGEETEQMWAFGKPSAKLMRYMSPANRVDWIDALLDDVAARKVDGIACALDKKYRETQKMLGDLSAQLVALEAAARRDGVIDTLGVAQEYRTSVVGTSRVAQDAVDLEADYVRALLHMRQLEALAGSAPDIAVVCSSTAARLMAASSSRSLDQARLRVAAAESALRRSEVHRAQWQPGYPGYDRGLQRLRSREVDSRRARIEQLALEVQKLQRQRAEAGASDQHTKKLMNRARRVRARVREVIDELYAWECLGVAKGREPAPLTEEQVKGLFDPMRQAPWTTDASASKAKRLYHGKLLFEATSDSDRCLEELGILRVERVRLEIWLSLAEKEISAAVQRHSGAERNVGAVFLLEKRLRVVRQLQQDIRNSRIPAP